MSAIVNPGGGGGAPTGSQYVVLALDGTLTAERRLIAPTAAPDATPDILLVDGGANGDLNLLSRGWNPRRTVFGVTEFYKETLSSVNSDSLLGTPGGSTAHFFVDNEEGCIRLSSGASANSGVVGYQNGSAAGTLDFDTDCTVLYRFRLNSTSTDRMWVGLETGATPAVPPGNAIVQVGLSYDSADSANFQFRSGDGTTASNTSSGVAADTAWHTIRVTRTSSTNLAFQLDNGTVTNKTTNVPGAATGLFTSRGIITTDATDKTLDVSYIAFWRTGMSR